MQLIDIAENPVPPHADVALVRAGSVQIRVARWEPAGSEAKARGTVVICPGRSEFIEKYAEVVAELLARNFAVVAFDWRGQGGSSRLLVNLRKGHVDDFAHYIEDLEAVRAQVLAPSCPRPWFSLAHSMGGAILIDHAAREPDLFARMVLTAPMIGIHGLRMPEAVRFMASTATRLGLGHLYVPGGSERSLMSKPFEGNVLTSDPRRFAAFAALTRAAPDLVIGAPTQGWLDAAFRLMRSFEGAEYPRRILTPILVVASGDDRVVDTRSTERLATRLKAGSLIVIPHARHEILMEQDRFRDQFWAAFDGFIPGSATSGAGTAA